HVVAHAVSRGLVPALPEETAEAAELLAEALDDDLWRVHGDLEGDPDLLPAHRDRDGGLRRGFEGVAQPLLERRTRRRAGDARGVVLLVVAEASPRSVLLAEDHRPVGLGRDHVEAVRARRELLAADGDVRGEGDRGVLVGAGPPDLLVGHELTPDLAVVD